MKMLGALLLILPIHVLACSCVGYSDEDAYLNHYNVFIGKLTEVKIHDWQYATGYLEPLFVAKGKVGPGSPLRAGGSMCSNIDMLEPNALYLVYGKKGVEAGISHCSATHKVPEENVDAVIEMLRKLEERANNSLNSTPQSGAN